MEKDNVFKLKRNQLYYNVKDMFKLIKAFRNIRRFTSIILSYRQHIIYSIRHGNGGLEFWDWLNKQELE